jgi:hypothetical protein
MHHKAIKAEIGKQLKTRYPQRNDIDNRSDTSPPVCRRMTAVFRFSLDFTIFILIFEHDRRIYPGIFKQSAIGNINNDLYHSIFSWLAVSYNNSYHGQRSFK